MQEDDTATEGSVLRDVYACDVYKPDQKGNPGQDSFYSDGSDKVHFTPTTKASKAQITSPSHISREGPIIENSEILRSS